MFNCQSPQILHLEVCSIMFCYLCDGFVLHKNEVVTDFLFNYEFNLSVLHVFVCLCVC